MWGVEYTDEFENWWMTLTPSQQEALDDRIMPLAQEGPFLGRPIVGKIVNSRRPNMKQPQDEGPLDGIWTEHV